jgi:exodeoxyribonuclease-3
MRLISANVNGIRAAVRRGGLDWLAEARPDALCLQEVRASDEQLAKALHGSAFQDWQVTHAACSSAGRAGVAVLTPRSPTRVQRELDDLGFSDCGRWVEADVSLGGVVVTLVSVYVHTGEAGTGRQDEKYAFLEAMSSRMKQLGSDGRLTVVTGDLNVAHRQADLKNWKGNLGRSGFLPQEQAYLDGWLGAGWVDVTRRSAGDVEGPYTWWSWRGKAFDNDTGWRIDYQLATEPLAQLVTATSVGRADSYAQRWSDHAAVLVDYELH